MLELQVINIFCDLQNIISNFKKCNINANQVLKLQIYQQVPRLVK